MDKRGQGISLNVIIIAALALIVLVILIAIFTGRIGTFGGEVASTEQRAKATAANIGKTVCDGTCFAHPKWDATNNRFLDELVGQRGVKRTTKCTDATEEKQAGKFTDLKSGEVCCVPSKPVTNVCSYE